MDRPRPTAVDPPPTTDPRRQLGAAGEDLAAAHLRRRDYRIVERNARTRYGEIDIIAHRPPALVFVEVKTRRAGGRAGSALEAVDPRKRAQVRRMAAIWLARTRDRPHADELRFDVIAITVDRSRRLRSLEHLEAAF